MSGYDPDDPRLAHVGDCFTSKQKEALLRILNEGWRLRSCTHRGDRRDVMIVHAERVTPGGVDEEGVRWRLTALIDGYGEELERNVIDI